MENPFFAMKNLMEHFFKNFFVVIFLTGAATRILNRLYRKQLKFKTAISLSGITSFFVFGFPVTWLLGFDVMVSLYVFGLIFWFFFDILRGEKK